MKRSVVIFILSALVIVLSAVWFANAKISLNLAELMPFGILVLVVGIALFIGIKRIKSIRRGEPAEDELSKKILVKTSSISYYVSIYLWLFLGFFSDRLNMENHTLIGIGIAGMALIYVLFWVFFSLRGLRDE